jgi:putative tryptophan/tyrosine transport system substrate-binding protein
VNRRKTLSSLLAIGVANALPAIAQSAQFRIGWISPTTAADGVLFLDALRRGLRALGYVEGGNIRIDTYWGDNSSPRIEQHAGELVASHPHVIVAQGPTALVVRRATATIPVVFGFSGDPVEGGLVESLRRPGRNLTGISFLTLELVGKRIELLKETLPDVKQIAVIANPQHAGDQVERRVTQVAARALGLSLEYFEARNGAELVEALTAIEKTRCDAVMLFPVQFVISNRERIAAWSIKHRLPTISGWAQFAEGGNLLTYGPNLVDSYARLAVYVDRILKGATPADLPVELPTRVELVVNMKTANALGLKIPQSVLLRADRVIE